MIITYGDTSNFGDMPWYMVELRSERTIENTLRRLAHAIPGIFDDAPVELFIPIVRRDLNVCELSTVDCIFARSPDFQKLLRMKTVTGIGGLVTEGDTKNPSKAIPVENRFVQESIAHAEQVFAKRAETIEVGGFVRVIDGDSRDWCGYVVALHNGTSVVKVDLKTKILFIETASRNLLDLNHVPEHLRVFYYADLVKDLNAHHLADLISQDLVYQEDALYEDDGLVAPKPAKYGRQQTVTALVKRMIISGNTDPAAIAEEVVRSLHLGLLRKPKNLHIVHGVIKTRLVEDHFKKLNPAIKSYHDVIETYGDEYKLTIRDLTEIDSSITVDKTKRKSNPRKTTTTTVSNAAA